MISDDEIFGINRYNTEKRSEETSQVSLVTKCPDCGQKVKPFRYNMEMVIMMCQDKKCDFPFNHGNLKNYIYKLKKSKDDGSNFQGMSSYQGSPNL
mmetsp:Transcript_22686/g.19705  ORF Transcript_22686/g.19705 Transcript_22686/m.19705 type:complete len:96 (+) Transcript_22686:148-435(+)